MNGNELQSLALNVSRHAGKIQVIKIGGEVVEDDQAIRHQVRQAIDLTHFGAKVIIVHGGGVQITQALEAAGIEAKFVNGLRHTSAEAVEITKQCLETLNAKIVAIFQEEAKAMKSKVCVQGFGGFECGVEAAPIFEGTRTGKITRVDADDLKGRFDAPCVSFVYPICEGPDGGYMNVNADDVSAAMAIAVNADRLIICSNIPGVLDKDKKLISKITIAEIQGLIDDGTVSGGMIPKLQSAADVILQSKVGGVVILNGKDPSAIERELFTEEGGGTLIVR